MIGDSDSDIVAGKATRCKAIKIEEGGLIEVVKGIFNDNYEDTFPYVILWWWYRYGRLF